jgi:flagellin-specific chaperone FliS
MQTMTQDGRRTTSEVSAAQRAYQTPQGSTAVNAYQREQVMNLSPVEVIQKLYDVAIVSCKKGDRGLAQRALNELIVSLNFDHKEIALGLYRLYDYCKRCIGEGRPGDAVSILVELRATWAKAFQLEN